MKADRELNDYIRAEEKQVFVFAIGKVGNLKVDEASSRYQGGMVASRSLDGMKYMVDGRAAHIVILMMCLRKGRLR